MNFSTRSMQKKETMEACQIISLELPKFDYDQIVEAFGGPDRT